MKKLVFISIIWTVLLCSINAQNLLGETQVKSSLTQIFNLSKDQNYSTIAHKLLDSKNLREFNFKTKSDEKAVKRIAKKIKAYLDLSDSYEYESLTFGKFKNLPSADLKVNFKSGDQNLKISFLFVEFNNKILLAKFK